MANVTRLLNLVVEVTTPKRTALLDTFPALAHIPPWMPGSGWQRLSRVLTTSQKRTGRFHSIRARRDSQQLLDLLPGSDTALFMRVFPRPQYCMAIYGAGDIYEMRKDNSEKNKQKYASYHSGESLYKCWDIFFPLHPSADTIGT
ncbi:hypothetical protein EDD16DRAFT_1612848 [Pisolithus croceorrhizus]|nr:hypothetical protein EDD16DRAFT_1612848 [Pisolithus croceorrhizus]